MELNAVNRQGKHPVRFRVVLGMYSIPSNLLTTMLAAAAAADTV